MLRRIAAATTAIGVLGLLMGCNPPEKPAEPGTPEEGKGTAAEGKAPSTGIKIGFLVKQAEEQWFQDEWRFAKEAGAKNGFEVVEIAASDGEKVLTGIDNLAAQGVKGFIICTPDVKLGPAIVAKADAAKMKVFSVDDQFIGTDGKPMDVHHMGISAHDIGYGAGEALWAEMQKRGWKPSETGLLVPTFDQLPTAKERTDGAMEALAKAGFPKARMFQVSQKSSDVPGGIDATNIALTQHGDVKKWLVCGMNDEAVLGAVRAMEGRNLRADSVIGVGIGGTKTAQDEFAKPQPTGFFGTMLISPKRHGYETAELMFKWVKDGVEPPKTTFTSGILITREDYKAKLKEQGLQ